MPNVNANEFKVIGYDFDTQTPVMMDFWDAINPAYLAKMVDRITNRNGGCIPIKEWIKIHELFIANQQGVERYGTDYTLASVKKEFSNLLKEFYPDLNVPDWFYLLISDISPEDSESWGTGNGWKGGVGFAWNNYSMDGGVVRAKYTTAYFYPHATVESSSNRATNELHDTLLARSMMLAIKRMQKYIDDNESVSFTGAPAKCSIFNNVVLVYPYYAGAVGSVNTTSALFFIYLSNQSGQRTPGTISGLTSLWNSVSGDKSKVEFSWYSGRLLLRSTVVDKSYLYNQMPYSFNFFQWARNPRIVTHVSEAEEPIYGVELELSTRYNVRDLIDAVDLLWICAKYDGSITGRFPGKHEMVTLPATLKAHKKLWAKWFSVLDIEKFDTTRNTNNGMHVHISRESFDSKRHQRDFAWFWSNPACKKFVIECSERGELNDYCRLPDVNPADKANKNTAVRKNIMNYISGLRGCINTNKSATIEVRIFKGIVSYATVVKNLEMVDATFNFTRSGVSYSCNPLVAFLDWLNKTPKNKYPALKEFLNTIDVAACVVFAKTVHAIMGSTSHTEALSKLKPIMHELNEECVDVLNEVYGRSYHWDFKTNSVIAITEKISTKNLNKGVLAHKDKDYLSRYTRTAYAS